MKFISIFTHEPSNAAPDPKMMETMNALVQAGMKEGWLIATEGVSFSDKPIKVSRSKGGKVSVTDGPFTEAKEVLGGYALLEAKNREHVIELSRRFLEVAGSGTCEVHELFQPPK